MRALNDAVRAAPPGSCGDMLVLPIYAALPPELQVLRCASVLRSCPPEYPEDPRPEKAFVSLSVGAAAAKMGFRPGLAWRFVFPCAGPLVPVCQSSICI